MSTAKVLVVGQGGGGGGNSGGGGGAVGTQYFNTFFPSGSDGGTTFVATPQALILPPNETAQCIGSLGTNLVIGTGSNILYPWDRIVTSPTDIIYLPEANAVNIITVNNMAYIFAGNKGNIYISNGPSASSVIKVPDYCAGIDGTPSTYVEPYFTWGGAMYLRGRVYFSILDQTSSKTGKCGGVWSFVPTQNLFFGQDTGVSLKQENQSSYGTYNGVSVLLIPSQNQQVKSPQFWSAWYSSVSSPTYGIDNTASSINTSMVNAVIETDLMPVGTYLTKKTFGQIEYKLTTLPTANESVTFEYRTNEGSAYTSVSSTVSRDSTTSLSGYYPVTFETSQWLQLRITLSSSQGLSTTSFVRLSEVRLR